LCFSGKESHFGNGGQVSKEKERGGSLCQGRGGIISGRGGGKLCSRQKEGLGRKVDKANKPNTNLPGEKSPSSSCAGRNWAVVISLKKERKVRKKNLRLIFWLDYSEGVPESCTCCIKKGGNPGAGRQETGYWLGKATSWSLSSNIGEGKRGIQTAKPIDKVCKMSRIRAGGYSKEE